MSFRRYRQYMLKTKKVVTVPYGEWYTLPSRDSKFWDAHSVLILRFVEESR